MEQATVLQLVHMREALSFWITKLVDKEPVGRVGIDLIVF